jgi:hypothetical protein
LSRFPLRLGLLRLLAGHHLAKAELAVLLLSLRLLLAKARLLV